MSFLKKFVLMGFGGFGLCLVWLGFTIKRLLKENEEYEAKVIEKDTFVHSKATKDHLLNQYYIGEMIGKGEFGEVYKATHRLDGSQIAIKTIKKHGMSKFEIAKAVNEIDTLQKLDHPNISKYFENYEDSNFLYICMELVEGGDLKDKNLQEIQVAPIFKKLVLALKHCHEQDILHQEIQPANIMLTKCGDVKLIDFGLAHQ